eukprot:902920-Prorocentrum_minimum.AAC.1
MHTKRKHVETGWGVSSDRQPRGPAWPAPFLLCANLSGAFDQAAASLEPAASPGQHSLPTPARSLEPAG